MNVLVVGGGGREHALCEAVLRSKKNVLYSVMSHLNPGIERIAEKYLVEKETNIRPIVDYAVQQKIDLVLIGPEAPLEQGLTDALQQQNINVCAPTQQAAQIETNKEWMRNLLQKYKIPGQLQYASFTDPTQAEEFLKMLQCKVAIKPIGLTGGKGVQVYGDHFTTFDSAMSYISSVISQKIGGAAKVLIEEKAEGEEFTIQAFSDGKHIKPCPAVQDHKRLLPNDQGVNTGGMGSYSCSNGLLPFLSQKDYDSGTRILQKIIHALDKEGYPYIGPIYGQFMLTRDGVRIIEINARFGDPEAMNVLPLLKTDFLEICTAMLEQKLHELKLEFEKKSTVCKYVVPEGYGIKSRVGEKIELDEQAIKNTGAKLFYASVTKKDNHIITGSSRSLGVVGIADTLQEAEQICEQALQHIKSEHIFIRHDIGTPQLIQKRINHMKMIRGKP
ncbi:MAG: phosphoribosylamine--glycine ligase [Candidatus Thermoplasmatota archaeon]